MEKMSREKMGWWKVSLCFMVILLCVFEGRGQDVNAEETTTLLSEEVVTVLEGKATGRFTFPKDRKPSSVSTRIIGGSVATANAYPYQVALYVAVGNVLYFCGGTLIAPQWVLTAAHCVDLASSVEVVLGAHNLNAVEAARVIYNSSTFIIHKDWNETLLQNDIALIRLPQNVTFTDTIAVVNIAQGSDSYSGIIGRCLGWGRTILGSLSNVLRYVDLEVITNDNCNSYEDYAGYIVDHHLCTSGAGIVGSCNGDSGGPLVIDGVQVGIVSFGVNDCAAGLPSVFTRVTNFNSWITESIENWTGDGSQTQPLMGLYIGLMLCVTLLNAL